MKQEPDDPSAPLAATEVSPALPKRVLLVANYLPDHQYSMQRYCTLLQQGLGSQGLEISIARPQGYAGRLKHALPRLKKYLSYFDKFVCFPVTLRRTVRQLANERDVLIHLLDQGNGVYLNQLGATPFLVTCHDLIAIKEASGSTRRASECTARRSRLFSYQRKNLRALKKAPWFACVSDATRQDCMRFLDARPERCEVIYNPLDPFFLQRVTGRPDVLPPRFLLHIGNSAWYKNRTGLLQIYQRLRILGCDVPLVLMGEPLSSDEKGKIAELALGTYVILVEAPEDETIRAAYAHAEALIFPSLEEGFGWPILEALAQGCPVFTTGVQPMTEAGGTVATYFDPHDPELAASEIFRALNPVLRDDRLVAARRKHAESFSMERFVEGYLGLYERVMRDAASASSSVPGLPVA